nr:MAG: replication associated protein [Cressdnaviricota sp.]
MSNWTVTINNPMSEDYLQFAQDVEVFKYWAYADEVGEQGTPHIQGFVALRKKVRITGVKKIFPRAHIEPMRGNFGQNESYCSKQGQLIEWGEKPDPKAGGRAEKRRWEDILTCAKEGRIDDIDADVQIRYYNTLKKIKFDHQKVDHHNALAKHYWIWGSTGTGKTHAARMAFPDAYLKDPKTAWWDLYSNQEVVIIEDFDKYQLALAGDMKRWVDVWSFMAQFKGGSMVIRPKTIIVTSNYSIEQIWEDYTTQDCFNRRFIVIEKKTKEQVINFD